MTEEQEQQWVDKINRLWRNIADDVDPDEAASLATKREVVSDQAYSQVTGWEDLSKAQRTRIISKVRLG